MNFYRHAVSFLMIPTCMSFISSMIGVACLAFTEFDMVRVFAFQPLVIVMAVTYFNGCWWLPALLSLLNWNILQLGEEIVIPTTVSSTGDENTQARSSPADSREEAGSETLVIENTSRSEFQENVEL
jgi:hypothetical protein